ncbi:high mobility group B protein 7 [Oryza brachyantha]|uniref:HMG box domain-containing protein n=1 Tax=Oryza brachyantha TaxID=4533 RepID=J3MPI3_ORYBR|nr:high mobility group B protein 7 [Oryza brachyantha]
MAGKSGARTRKRVEATEAAVLKRARDGSAFTRCEACGKSVSVALIDMHNCSLDDKIRMTLEAQVVEQAVEVTANTKKGKGDDDNKKKKGKRPPTAFFLFLADFRKEYKAEHPGNKSVSAAAKEGGERWKAMSDEEKKPYLDKAAELKAEYDNGEHSDENNVGGKAADEQEVDQPPSKSEPEEERNELDDDM